MKEKNYTQLPIVVETPLTQEGLRQLLSLIGNAKDKITQTVGKSIKSDTKAADSLWE